MLSNQQITDIIITALEGGSNYWYSLEMNSNNAAKSKDQSRAEFICEQVLKHNATFQIFDIDDDEHLGELSKESIKKGIKLVKANYPEYIVDVKEGDFDAEIADIFFQYFILGEIVFG
jgi:hypothetical protein